jgi:large subunit ribosomal protein L25
MERMQVSVELRNTNGKGPARRLRASGRVPAVLYGFGTSTISLSVPAREIERAVGSNQLLDLTGINEVKGRPVLLKAFQRDPVSQNIWHCDFYAVDTSKNVVVSVPVHLTGKPIGIDLGGILESLVRAVQVSCLPLSIPTVLNADVTELSIGGVLHARSLQLPDGVTLVTDPEASIAHVISPKIETTTTETPAEGAEGAPAEGEAAAAAEGAKTDDD